MTWLKVSAVIVGAVLLLGLGFIEPTKNMQDQGLRGLIIMLGLAICIPLTIIGIHRVRSPHRKEVDHED